MENECSITEFECRLMEYECMATGPTIEVRFKPPRVLYDRWRAEARALGLTIGQWLTLKTEGKLATAESSAQVLVQASRENDRPLWARIEAAIPGELNRSRTGELAKRLGVSRR